MSAGVRKLHKRYVKHPGTPKATHNTRREFYVFLVLGFVFFTVRHYLKVDLPVFYFDLAEHSALVVEIASMAGFGSEG